jgi:tetratricopeptide (TPR) repeat protein
MKIFLSAVSDQFRECRNALASDLRAIGCEVKVQEDFQQGPRTLIEQIERYVAQCDRVIALVGDACGCEATGVAVPAVDPPRSYTQWEYFFALGHRLDGSCVPRKDIYLYLASPKYLDEHPVYQSAERALWQQRFQEEIRASGEQWNDFDSLDHLCRRVLRDGWQMKGRPSKPIHLPLDTIGSLFKGREAFLADLHRRLGVSTDRATAIVNRLAVHGLGGIGKTRGALEYAWRHTDDYTALLFVSAPSVADLRANLANLSGVLGTTAQTISIDQQLTEVLRWLDEHPGWLLIIDNVDTNEAAAEVQRMLARLRSGHVLITSRISNWSAGVQPLELDVLTSADAAVFLMERTPHRSQRADDAPQASAIARQLDGLALALEQAGAYIDKQRLSFAEYLERWVATRPEVLRWHDPRLMQYPASVAVTWEATFTQLTGHQRQLLEVLAWLAPEPVPLFLFDATPLADAIPDPRDALAGLAAYSLARFEAAGDAILVHRLVQEITRSRVPEANCTGLLKIALEAVDAAATGDPSDVRSWHAWTPLAAHVDTVSRHADAVGLAVPTDRLMSQLGLYWRKRGQFRAAEPLIRRALAIDERFFGNDHPNVANCLNNLALLLQATNHLAEAEPLIRRALDIAERSFGNDHPEVATNLNNLALLLQATNRLAEAEPLMRRALAIDERFFGNEKPEIARDLNNLAWLLKGTNRMAEAEPLMRRALAIAERSFGNDHPEVATNLNNLALLLQATNRLAEAEPLMRRALAIDEKSFGNDHPNIATDLNNLAVLLKATNRLAEAEPLMRRALAIDELSFGNDHPEVATSLHNLARMLQATNRLAEAEPLMHRALVILIESTRRTGCTHPHRDRILVNYRGLREALGETRDQIEQRLRELDDSLNSNGS